MESGHQFKVLVVINWLLQLLLHLLPVPSLYSDPMVGRLTILDGYGALFNWTDPMFYQLPLWGFFVSSLGMIFFKNWARYLYLVLWFYGWGATLLFGVRVILPLEGFIGMAIGTGDGAILYMAFFSSLRDGFKKAHG